MYQVKFTKNNLHHHFLALLFAAYSAGVQALPIINGSFEQTIGRTGNTTTPATPTSGMLDHSANITGPSTTIITLPGWQTSRDGIGCIVVFPSSPSTSVCGSQRFAGRDFQGGGPGFSKDGGNFILIDGDSTVSTAIYQPIGGLVVGQSYNVKFEQAAAQFQDGIRRTTEQWDVSLGGDPANHPNGDLVGGTHILSHLMNPPSHGFTPWENQTLTFIVTDPMLAKGSVTSQILSFFAVGAPNGDPPIVLLDSVSITAVSVPEPGLLVLFSVGIIVLVIARFRRSAPT